MKQQLHSTNTSPTILESITNSFLNIFNIHGRTGRREFWIFFILWIILHIVSYVAFPPRRAPQGFLIFHILLIIPVFSIIVRRLHDLNRSMTIYSIFVIINLALNIYYLHALVTHNYSALNINFSIINYPTHLYEIWLFISFCKKGDLLSNKYGPSPYKTKSNIHHPDIKITQPDNTVNNNYTYNNDDQPLFDPETLKEAIKNNNKA